RSPDSTASSRSTRPGTRRWRHCPPAGPQRRHLRRTAALLIIPFAAVLLAAGCGTGGKAVGGDASHGKQLFNQKCAGCHTLTAAGTSGTVGPNLDQLKPPEARVVTQVTNGGAQMPAFKGRLTAAQIQAVAKYVSSVAGK